ncbi:MAG: hypothetical protein EBV03_02350 [Proteobacteria bacterium]|nr:hypothetical protein [Pseudomonadota bacterium]
MLSGIQHPQYSGTSRLSAFDKALIRSAPLAEKIIKELLFQLAKGSSPGQISFEFERRLESFGRERANWVMQNLAHRNTYLVKAIREARASPEKVAFFIAGVAHLLPTETTPDEALEPVTREIVRKQDWALLCMDDPKIKRKHPLMKQLESEPESEVAHDI